MNISDNFPPKKKWTASELRKLAPAERDAILEAAATLAEQEYRNNPELTAFEAEKTMELSISEIRDRLADALDRVAHGGERVILTRRGKSVAVLVSLEDLSRLQALEDKADVRAARKALKEKGGITLQAYRKKHGL